MALSYVVDPEFVDVGPDPDALSLPVPEPVGESTAHPRSKRPSELPGASVPSPAGQWLTVAQAAVELKVTPRRVRALVSAGWLKARAVNPRLILIRRSDLGVVRVRYPGRPKGVDSRQ